MRRAVRALHCSCSATRRGSNSKMRLADEQSANNCAWSKATRRRTQQQHWQGGQTTTHSGPHAHELVAASTQARIWGLPPCIAPVISQLECPCQKRRSEQHIVEETESGRFGDIHHEHTQQEKHVLMLCGAGDKWGDHVAHYTKERDGWNALNTRAANGPRMPAAPCPAALAA